MVKNAWGRQTGYAEPQNLVTASYTYGADGLRRSKTVGGTTTTFVWDGANLVYEKTGSSDTVYTYGATLIKSSNGSATYVYVFNGHGDVVQLLAGTSVVKSYSYDAFGNEIGINAADTNPFRYCGEYYDKESGTIYLRARYYNPSVGRFNQEDTHWHPGNMIYGDNPVRLKKTYVPDTYAIIQSSNLYMYCINNPCNCIDPSGYSLKELWELFAQTIQEARGVFAFAGGISQLDSPLPGPADVTGVVIASVTVVICAGIAIYETTTADAIPISIPKTEEQEKDIINSPTTPTLIFRYGGTNPSNLTPRSKDRYTGLSFSTIPKPGAAVTTIEALNATGIVFAVRDGATHVSVRPIGGTIDEWIETGPTSIWTQAVRSVVKKNGG